MPNPPALPLSGTVLPTKESGWTLPTALRVPLICVAVWGLVQTAMCVAIYGDAQRQGQVMDFGALWLRNLPVYLPLMAYSWALHGVFSRFDAALQRARSILALLVLSGLLFIPIYMVYQEAVEALWHGKPLGGLGALLARQRFFNWWSDSTLMTLAFAAQLAFSMSQRQRRREQALEQAQREVLALRLSLLQGQLEPHFLFNSLNCVSALVRTQQAEQALSALAGLADLLRYALHASRVEWVSVAQELGFVRGYLALQTLRFGPELRLEEDIEAQDWSSLKVPPLLLQPLVENAVRHGLEPAGGAGWIRLSLRHTRDALELQVANSRPAQGRQPGHGLGLASTRERLCLLYGAEAGLQTQDLPDRFELRLHLPARER